MYNLEEDSQTASRATFAFFFLTVSGEKGVVFF